jgi:serine phosphatase RsbU (regulator of sigma subunit)
MCCCINVYGQNTQTFDRNAKVKALFIYAFTHYFEWPNQSTSNEFRIGVLAENKNLLMELERMATLKKVGNLSIKIIPFLKMSDLTQVELLYVDTKNNPDFKVSKIQKNILLVSEYEKNLDNAMIAFFISSDNKQKIAINEVNIKKSGVKMLPEFNSLASHKITGTNEKQDEEKANEWRSVFDKFADALKSNSSEIKLSNQEAAEVIATIDANKKTINEKEEKLIIQEKSLWYKENEIKTQQKNLAEQKNKIDEQLQSILTQEQKLKLQEQKLEVTIQQNKAQEADLEIAKQEVDLQQGKINAQKSILLNQQKDIDVQNKKLINQLGLINSQKTILYLAGLLVLIIAVALVIAYRSNKNIQRANSLLSKQKIEIEHQRELVTEKQKEIIESITYAKRLQEAILPPKEFIDKYVPNNFILYKPKDLVAGDFYWAEHVGDRFFIAAADSTGHGVPGAMVSVVCSNALNRTVKEFNLTDTGKILDKTRELVLETFAKSTSDVKDGMDISLLCIDTKNKQLFWSGANNPLWYIQNSVSSSGVENKELKEIKADKQPIGKSDHAKPFTTHQIEYKENTTFYLFTDGFADQFGGPKGKKFKYKQLSDLLVINEHLSIQEQGVILDKVFSEWKGDLEQVDDVCVIGFKL